MGVGTGACAKRIVPMINQYVGIDIASYTIEALKEHFKEHNMEFYCFSMCDNTVPTELKMKFTKAYSFDSLEHVECPQRFFENLALMLVPNGEAIIGFPNESLPEMHGITSFRTLGDMLAPLENTSLKVVRVYELHRSFLFKNFKRWLWDPIIKVGKFIIASRNYCPQCFDDTLAFRLIIKPRKPARLLNIYASFLIKIASTRPIFHYIPLMERDEIEIYDRYILLHLRLQKTAVSILY
ncbi:MAG: class I SAM-dependent methyltransferase [Desulfobacterales bacterium]|nr:class I SAM-dependent methyltransferase [Desulfobacterales bacterium]